MQFVIGGMCFLGGLLAIIFLGSLNLGFALTIAFAVPLVILAVYGLAKMPTEGQEVRMVSKPERVGTISKKVHAS